MLQEFTKVYLKERLFDLSQPLTQENVPKYRSLAAGLQVRWIRLAPGGKKNLYTKQDILAIIKELITNPEFRDDEEEVGFIVCNIFVIQIPVYYLYHVLIQT